MLNRKTPDTLASTITVEGQGDKFEVAVVYNNRTDKQVAEKQAALDEEAKVKGLEGQAAQDFVNAELFLYVVREVNGVTPTIANHEELNENFPGVSIEIYMEYRRLRQFKKAKN